ncbi:hypothetical protein EDB86DRAFT_3080947 [Lactarius hatsudake]|nr:hypothetical protein EDB86DRAFT_3080947 [Lactarius hatsudake]
MHTPHTRIGEPDDLRPTKILKEADKLMEQARALYENHEQIMKPIDRTVAEDKMTWAKDFRHGVEEKSWMDQAEQAKLYFNQAQEALETVKVVFTIPFLRRGKVIYVDPMLYDPKFSTNGLLRLGATICNVQPDLTVKGGSRSFRKGHLC